MRTLWTPFDVIYNVRVVFNRDSSTYKPETSTYKRETFLVYMSMTYRKLKLFRKKIRLAHTNKTKLK